MILGEGPAAVTNGAKNAHSASVESYPVWIVGIAQACPPPTIVTNATGFAPAQVACVTSPGMRGELS